jgi:hypothetical protein
MSFIDDKTVEEAKAFLLRHYIVEEDSVEGLVRDVFFHAEQKLTPLFVEFGEWLSVNYVPVINGKINIYWLKENYQAEEQLTTKEVFVLWMEERDKLNT